MRTFLIAGCGNTKRPNARHYQASDICFSLKDAQSQVVRERRKRDGLIDIRINYGTCVR